MTSWQSGSGRSMNDDDFADFSVESRRVVDEMLMIVISIMELIMSERYRVSYLNLGILYITPEFYTGNIHRQDGRTLCSAYCYLGGSHNNHAYYTCTCAAISLILSFIPPLLV